jgi:hypothetical protein
MDEKKKEQLKARIIDSGHSPIEADDKKLRYLEAIDMAAQRMLQRRREAQETLRKNEVNVMSVEREMKGQVDCDGRAMPSLTDQTMRRSALMMDFIATYAKEDATLKDERQVLKELQEEVARCKEELEMLHQRDADACRDKYENQRLAKRVADLTKTKADLENQLRKMETQNKGGKARGRIIELNIHKEEEGAS